MIVAASQAVMRFSFGYIKNRPDSRGGRKRVVLTTKMGYVFWGTKHTILMKREKVPENCQKDGQGIIGSIM